MRKIIAVLAVIGGVVIGIPLVAASPAVATTSTSISLTNADPGLGLADVMNNQNVSGNPVWTFDTTGNGIIWDATERGLVGDNGPFANLGDDSKFLNHAIYTFGDAQNPSLCLGQASGNVQLRSCNVNGSLWVLNGSWSNGLFSGQLINVERTNAQNGAIYVLAAPGQGDRQLLHVDSGAAAATDWRVWSFN